MKRKAAMIAASVLVLLSVAGCGATLQEVAEAKEICHDLGGTFSARWITEYQAYVHACDLSDIE